MVISILFKILRNLPLNFIYIISNFVYFLIFKVFKYRLDLVKKNITLTNLNLNSSQSHKTIRKFYQYFTDLYLESIKMDSFSKSDFEKRFTVINVEIVNKFFNEGKSVVLMLSHYGGYEWCTCLPYFIKHNLLAVYTPIKNKYINEFIKKSRSRHGLDLISRYDALKQIYKIEKKNKIPYLYGLVADQSPKISSNNYWSKFFGVKVPVFTGSERIAKKYNLPVVYGKMKKIKRGYYSVEFQLITDNPKKFKDFEITEKYLRLVENQLHEDPHPYLWTHNRFKHASKAPKD
ncbi:MAG: lysophospholipid acyltransferase family protein [Flavobacteriaceae bacterium]|nr:lysophospholipid acyltransferase family protein [Flavobacteriaceae bacterium]MBL6684430.1 lysophospholipid acyltransferase family protein [Flavobacteriaceae bacterium]